MTMHMEIPKGQGTADWFDTVEIWTDCKHVATIYAKPTGFTIITAAGFEIPTDDAARTYIGAAGEAHIRIQTTTNGAKP